MTRIHTRSPRRTEPTAARGRLAFALRKSGLVQPSQSFHHRFMMRHRHYFVQTAGFGLITLVTLFSPLPLVAQGKAPSDAPRQVRQYTIEQFMKTVRIGGGAF